MIMVSYETIYSILITKRCIIDISAKFLYVSQKDNIEVRL